jgi:hypothetical protein
MRRTHGRRLCIAVGGLFVALGAPTAAVSGTETATVKLSVIAGGQEEGLRSSFDRNALPPGSSDATFQNGEMFQLLSVDMPPLIIAPINFDTSTHAAGSDMRFDCGAFFLDAAGHRSFSRTTAALSPFNCMSLMALGAMPHEGPRPRLLFLYSMDLLHNMSGRHRFELDVLVWSKTRHSYAAAPPLSRWLTRNLSHPTIAYARHLLAARAPAGPSD